MNDSKHVVTRHQLNQISKITTSQLNLLTSKNLAKPVKQKVLTEDQKRQNKVESDRLERERRMEKRKQKLEQAYF